MHSLIDNRALLRFSLAGALALTAAACSRSDRADAGRDTSQTASVGPSDSHVAGHADTATTGTSAEATRPAPSATSEKENVSGYQPMRQDTSLAVSGEVSEPAANTDTATPPTAVAGEAAAQSDSVVVGDSTNVGKPGERLEENRTSEQANADSLAGQTAAPVRPPEDSSETIGVVSDTSLEVSGDTTAGAAQMARDTSTVLVQGDTSAQQSEVTVETADTTEAIDVQIDTATAEPPAELAQETPADTATVVGDSAEAGKTGERIEANAAPAEANADTLATETERVRPPEDSTEVAKAEANAEVHAKADADVEAVGDANAESVGAARVENTGGVITGEAAVAAMTREGQRCIVVDPEQSSGVRWDLASSPATMNPCGTGTMTLPRVQMGQ